MSDSPDAEDPAARHWQVIMSALASTIDGSEVKRPAQDEIEEAATILAAAKLVRCGLDIDTVERLFCDRDHTIKLTYDGATDEVGIVLDWEGGEPEEIAALGPEATLEAKLDG